MLQNPEPILNNRKSSQYISRVESNLFKIKNILQQALQDLKQTDRISTCTSLSSEKQIQRPHMKRKISLDSQQQRTQFLLESLIKGYVMVKHSLNAKPKNKYVYISENKKFLCWKSLQKDDEKRIPLTQITSVFRGQEQTIYQIKNKSMKSLDSCILILSKQRNLQLQAINIEQSVKFQLQLIIAIKNAQKTKLNSKNN